MKSFAWIGLVGVSLAAASANSGCTVSATSGDGGDDAGFLSEQESSTTPDTGTTPEAGTSPDANMTPETSAIADAMTTPDSGTTADASEGGTCSALQSVTFGSATCDQCVGDQCCNETTACFTGAENDCASAVSCFLDCLVGNTDAGVPPGTSTSCKSECAGFDAMASTFDAWVTCVSSNCAASACQ